MADHLNPNTVNEIVGVYEDPMIAKGVARQLGDLGIPTGAIKVGGADARVESLKAEMREEVDNTFMGPGNVGPFTKEMSKGLVRQTVVWTIALAALGCLLALFDWPGSDLDFGARLVIGALVGAATGATIGFVWGGARGAMREPSGHNLAAERGVTVAVAAPGHLASDAVSIMRSAEPIRLDLGTPEGSPIDTIETDEVRSVATDRDLPH